MTKDLEVGQFAGTNEETGPSIQLYDGTRFYLLHPRPEDINIEQIAHATSKLCRFTGHVSAFYSVAQHCVIVSRLVPSELALTGLLHDATEAYIGDVSKPLKLALDMLAPDVLTGIEERIHEAIAAKFEHAWPFPPEIKQADNIALATEKRDLMPGSSKWKDMPTPAKWPIIPLEPEAARIAFLARFAEIVLRPGQGSMPIQLQPAPQPEPEPEPVNAEDWTVVG